MKNHCAFSKNHSCPLWTDYELTCYELEEANSLSHSNWIEIERQYKYIQTLQKILSDNDIPYPEYSCAVTPQVRQTGNRLSGLAGTAYASLLA